MAMTPTNARKGFQFTGIFPLNQYAIPSRAFEPASVYSISSGNVSAAAGSPSATPQVAAAGPPPATPQVAAAGSPSATSQVIMVIAAGSPSATPQVIAAGSPSTTSQVIAAGSPSATPQVTAAGSPSATPEVVAADFQFHCTAKSYIDIKNDTRPRFIIKETGKTLIYINIINNRRLYKKKKF